MRLSAVAFLMILTTFFLSGCGQNTQVAVEDHSAGYYGRAALQQQAPLVAQIAAPRVAPVLPQPTVNPVVAVNSPQVQPVKSVVSEYRAPVIQNVTHTEPTAITTAQSDWQWPVEGKVTQPFGGERNGIASEGITIAAPLGTPIHAARSGEVAFVGSNIRDYGNIVILRHTDRTLTSYAHAEKITVKKGDKIAAGNVIGYVGQTGSVKTPQLHFALREGDRAIDPLSKLPQHFAAN